MYSEDKEIKLSKILNIIGLLIFIFALALAVLLYLFIENSLIPALLLVAAGIITGMVFFSLSANLKILIDIRNLLSNNSEKSKD